jgi:hypothetical protein
MKKKKKKESDIYEDLVTMFSLAQLQNLMGQ